MPSQVPNQRIDFDVASGNPMSKPRMRVGCPDVTPDVTLCDWRNIANAKVWNSEIVEQAAERRDQLGNRTSAPSVVYKFQGQKICACGHDYISTDLARWQWPTAARRGLNNAI
jgi:hypothetical protein